MPTRVKPLPPEWTEALRELCQSPDAKIDAALARSMDESTRRAIIESARLQSKARTKLGDGVWFVTEKSLQQATPWQVARLKASWLQASWLKASWLQASAPEDHRGDTFAIDDLCSGIGADAVGLAGVGTVTAVDIDAEVAVLAATNLANHAPRDFEQYCGDVADHRSRSGVAVHIDPDRRPVGRRTSDPDRYQPDWATVAGIACSRRASIIKLAPAARADLSSLVPVHRAWISLAGSVREQTLLTGETISGAGSCSDQKSAFIVRRDATWTVFRAGVAEVEASSGVPIATEPGSLMIDPDAAIRAAGLTESFAMRNGWRCLGGPAGFLTGDAMPTADACKMATIGRVIWTGSADDRKLRREFRRLNVFPAAIKARGVDHDPAALCRRYRECGERPVMLWIGRTSRRVVATMTEAIP